MEQSQISKQKKSRLKIWLKRVGLAGFLFFLVKGLIWLVIFFYVGKSCQQQDWF